MPARPEIEIAGGELAALIDADGLRAADLGARSFRPMASWSWTKSMAQVSFACVASQRSSRSVAFAARRAEGLKAEQMGVIVRAVEAFPRVEAACEAAGPSTRRLLGAASPSTGAASLCTMHLTKGLEFRAAAVTACADDIVPRETADDESELREVCETDRHLPYVACSRARERMVVSGGTPASQLLQDIGKELRRRAAAA